MRHAGPFVMTMAAAALALGCTGNDAAPERTTRETTTTARPLPDPVEVRQEPEGVELGDPAFEPLPGARAEFGRLGGAVYRIEIPEDWNGDLVLFMHGFEELGEEARATAPDIRRYLIAQGYAWGASSFSSTSWIPGRSADETAALWDHFAREHSRPTRAYAMGQSMGGLAAHLTAERYGDRFDGALGLCGGAAGSTAMASNAEYFAAGAYVAGVTQAQVDEDGVGPVIEQRILPALRDPARHRRFEDLMIDLTGGRRAHDRAGFHQEEGTNWSRVTLSVSAGLASDVGRVYELGPAAGVSSAEFNAAIPRVPTNDSLRASFLDGTETTGDLAMPLLTLHTTGDGQVPIDEAIALGERVDVAGADDRLVQRVMRDPGHCGFRTTEVVAAFDDLVTWVEDGERPAGDELADGQLVRLGGAFELGPRPGTPEAARVPGAARRVTLSGRLTLDGAPLVSDVLGVVVRRDGLVTNCQYELGSTADGQYELTVFAAAESAGCGTVGAELNVWAYHGDQFLYSQQSLRWPGDGASGTLDASFSAAAPHGEVPPTAGFAGEVFDADGRLLPPGTLIEAFVGDQRCGVASVRYTGSFSGYVMAVVGPEAIPTCEDDATITFLVDGQPTRDRVRKETRDGRDPVDLTVD